MSRATTGERLRFIMDLRGIKQRDILELAKPFCDKYKRVLTKNALSQYVSDKVEPRKDMLALLAEALNVDDAWIAGFDVPMERKAEAPTISEEERLEMMEHLFKRLSQTDQMMLIAQMEQKLSG